MTEDIVERLRESAEGWDDCGDTNNASFEREAADEIERLRAALQTVKEWHGYGLPPETKRLIDAALAGEKKDV